MMGTNFSELVRIFQKNLFQGEPIFFFFFFLGGGGGGGGGQIKRDSIHTY